MSRPPSNGGISLLSPYQRITTSSAFIPEIDGFRFVAILCIFLYHLSENIALNSVSETGLAVLSARSTSVLWSVLACGQTAPHACGKEFEHWRRCERKPS